MNTLLDIVLEQEETFTMPDNFRARVLFIAALLMEDFLCFRDFGGERAALAIAYAAVKSSVNPESVVSAAYRAAYRHKARYERRMSERPDPLEFKDVTRVLRLVQLRNWKSGGEKPTFFPTISSDEF